MSNNVLPIDKTIVASLVASRKMSPEHVLMDYAVEDNKVMFKNFEELKYLADKLVVPVKAFFEDNDLINGVKIGRSQTAFSRTIEKDGTKYYTYNHLATTKSEPNLMALRVINYKQKYYSF